MMAPHDDDPARAGIRVAEGAIELARAEIHLALVQARASGARLAVTAAVTAVAAFFAGVSAVVLVLLPVLWAFRPGPAIASLAIALAMTLVASLVALKHWRGHRHARSGEEGSLSPSHDPPGRDHAISR
jgi:uncharacterized membrane protein YqjE